LLFHIHALLAITILRVGALDQVNPQTVASAIPGRIPETSVVCIKAASSPACGLPCSSALELVDSGCSQHPDASPARLWLDADPGDKKCTCGGASSGVPQETPGGSKASRPDGAPRDSSGESQDGSPVGDPADDAGEPPRGSASQSAEAPSASTTKNTTDDAKQGGADASHASKQVGPDSSSKTPDDSRAALDGIKSKTRARGSAPDGERPGSGPSAAPDSTTRTSLRLCKDGSARPCKAHSLGMFRVRACKKIRNTHRVKHDRRYRRPCEQSAPVSQM
jgi:hypothetical protein